MWHKETFWRQAIRLTCMKPVFALFLPCFLTVALFCQKASGKWEEGGSNTPSATKTLKKSIKPFPFIYNQEVREWIRLLSQNKTFLLPWLYRSQRYLPLMKKILKNQGLPPELAYTSLIESGLESGAISSAKAVGYWQFIGPTAERFQLLVNEWLDERRDFEKSTKAAGNYLKTLYQEFENWPLSLAAYNMGEGRLRGLIHKHKTGNFWILAKKADFPRETTHYVPKIMAIVRIMKSPESYGFAQFSVLPPYEYDLFYVPGGTNIKTLALKTGSPFQELKTLNPELKTHLIPKYVSNYRVRIPKGSAARLSAWFEARAMKSK